MPEKTNVILIMTDQLRYDAIGINGSPICRTPSLDRLAQEGMRFTNAYSPCGLCTPARASVLTGHHPFKHGLLTNNDMDAAVREDLPDSEVGFSEFLSDKGWNCGYSGKWHVGVEKVPSHYGFRGMNLPGYGHPGRLYESYLQEHGLEMPQIVGQRDGNAATLSGPEESSIPAFLVDYTSNLLNEFADEYHRTGKPFCIWHNFWGPHSPYHCHEPYASMYPPEDIPAWLNYGDELDGKPEVQKRYLDSGFEHSSNSPWADWQNKVSKYWGRVTMIDAQIGHLLDALDSLGLSDNTVVIFTNDHGDSTGQHGGFHDKGPFMYEEVYHIPLIVRWPGHVARGSSCEEFVSLVDVMPTILNLADVSVPDHVDGRSLLPLMSGHQPDDWPDHVVSEWHGHRFLYSERMIRWSHYKYVFNPGDRDELYDLGSDPYELRNVVDDRDYADSATLLRHKLFDALVLRKDPIRFAAWWMLLSPSERESVSQSVRELRHPYHLQHQRRKLSRSGQASRESDVTE